MTVVSEKDLKKKYDAQDGRRVASSETALCFLAQYTDKTHSVAVVRVAWATAQLERKFYITRMCTITLSLHR